MHIKLRRIIAVICMLAAPSVGPATGLAQQTSQPKNGKIEGTVYNVASGDPLLKARVEVVGKTAGVETGVDGAYSITVEPGTYSVRFFRDGFIEQTVDDVVVQPGASKELNAVLSPVGYGESVTVSAGNSGEIASMIEERKSATTISDTISAREISKDTASSAAGVLQRVPGVSVVDRFVFVRGLGERYSNTSLNDALIPTTEPDRKVVPMDLIPSNLLQSVKILKTFTPDQPGEFSGGLVKLETIDFPKAATLSVKFSTGFNTKTHGRDFFGYPGSGGFKNFFGFGRGDRPLPPGIPSGERLRRANDFEPGGQTPEELQAIGQSFSNIFTPVDESARPVMGWNVSGGAGLGKWGLVGGLSFKSEPQTLNEQRNYYRLGGEAGIVPNATYDYDSSTYVSRLGGTLNLTYQLTANDKLFFKNFLTNQATDEARIFEGFYLDRGSVIRNTRLRYIEERIYTGQVSGNHLLSWLGDTVAIWRYTYSRATLDEPDLREALYEFVPAVGDFAYFPQTQSLFHLFNKMGENIREPAFDIAKYWFLGSVSINAKAGASYINRDRGFISRRFRFLPRGNATQVIDTSLPPEQLLAGGNINPINGFEIREETRPTDEYAALHNITAGYAMSDVTLRRWRFIGGARVEKSVQRVNTLEPFNPNAVPVQAELENTDWLPSLGLVYAIKNGSMNLRAGFSRTIARPQFRELSPFEFTEVTGGRSVIGNPDLKRTLITNYDVRWEWFVNPSEVLAVSVFHKDLKDPIEVVIEPTTNLRTSFRNADKARNTGVELELRKNLGPVWSALRHVTLNTNYTLVHSRVDIGDENVGILTNANRPLVGQAENILNVSLDYEKPEWGFETRALYNYTGERLTDVGALGLPDIIEHGYPHLDLIFAKTFGGEKKWRAEFQMENLLNRQIDLRLGNLPFQVYRTGRTFEFGISYRIF